MILFSHTRIGCLSAREIQHKKCDTIQNSVLTQTWDLLVHRILMHNSTRLRNFWFNFHISSPSLTIYLSTIRSRCHFRWIIPCKFETQNTRRHQRARNVNCLSFTIDSYSWSRVSSLILLYHRIKFEMFEWGGMRGRLTEKKKVLSWWKSTKRITKCGFRRLAAVHTQRMESHVLIYGSEIQMETRTPHADVMLKIPCVNLKISPNGVE